MVAIEDNDVSGIAALEQLHFLLGYGVEDPCRASRTMKITSTSLSFHRKIQWTSRVTGWSR